MWGNNIHLGWRQIYLEGQDQPQDGITYHEVNLCQDNTKYTLELLMGNIIKTKNQYFKVNTIDAGQRKSKKKHEISEQNDIKKCNYGCCTFITDKSQVISTIENAIHLPGCCTWLSECKIVLHVFNDKNTYKAMITLAHKDIHTYQNIPMLRREKTKTKTLSQLITNNKNIPYKVQNMTKNIDYETLCDMQEAYI